MFLLNFFLYSSRTLTKQAKQEKKKKENDGMPVL